MCSEYIRFDYEEELFNVEGMRKRYIQALSAIANDQKSYRLYGLGKADKNIRIEVVDEKKEMASETTKTINSGLAVKKGIPLVW
ncbi:hypothetical protein Tco_0321705 [Tanacetum coccineum]